MCVLLIGVVLFSGEKIAIAQTRANKTKTIWERLRDESPLRLATFFAYIFLSAVKSGSKTELYFYSNYTNTENLDKKIHSLFFVFSCFLMIFLFIS